MSESDWHDDDHGISEADLHAFVDNQLDADDRRRVRRAIRRNPALAEAVCDLDQMKDWVQQAYAAPPLAPNRRPERPRAAGWRRALAASLLMIVGGTAGWFASSNIAPPAGDPDRLADATTALQDAAVGESSRVILHVGSADRQAFDEALDTAERLMAGAETNPDFHLQVLTNASGVDLVRRQVTPYAGRIEALLQRYPNLEFTACSQTLARLEREGQEVTLLPNVKVVDTAVSEVVRRLQRGWSYIRI
ncbi:MAG: hypothetical protein JXJ30_01530 [Halothiobacillaceae bacterium]|nr:hypothetical protein [Halothiobacillaceae bacterium]